MIGRWIVCLNNERCVEVKSINELVILDYPDDKNLLLLKYLDPYGITFFNRYQLDDVIVDLELIKKEYGNDKGELRLVENDKVTIDKIVTLAKECKEDTHKYLVFYGD